ncbi:MAG: hypothetical protein ABFC96_17070 [Thermoguttaceae bacterium]
MDSLRQASVQLLGFWRSLPSGSRTMVGLLVTGLLLTFGYLGTRPAPGPDVDLMQGPVAADQLPAMVAAFAKANLKGYEIRGTSILVPRGEEAAYMAALSDAKALPRLGDAMEDAIKAGNPFMSSRDREEMLKNAKQRELALMIRSMRGIESAYVICDIDNRPNCVFGGEKLITATVSVKPVGTARLDESQVASIRHVVSSAFASLKPENVTVSDMNGPTTWYGKIDENDEQVLYASLRRTCEQDLKAKILNSLSFVPSVTAEVSVELDRQQIARMKKGKSVTRTQDAGPTPVLARVSIGVPMSYIKQVWRERQPVAQASSVPDTAALNPIAEEESAKIRRHVAQLLPPTPTRCDLADQVAVTTFEDLRAVEPSQGLVQETWKWLVASWRPIGLFALALVCLFFFRATVRGNRDAKQESWPSDGSAVTCRETAAEAARQEPARVPAPHWRRPSDAAVAEQLSELVEADPEAAAGILRTWIGQAS